MFVYCKKVSAKLFSFNPLLSVVCLKSTAVRKSVTTDK